MVAALTVTAKAVLFDAEARARIAHGLDTLANAVKVTLGPRGRNVVIAKPSGATTITKDGATVAQEIELADRFANLGAQLVKEVASKTSDLAGDGTTTATVLAHAIFSAGARLVAGRVNPLDVKRGIDAAVAVVLAELARLSRPTRSQAEIAQVATVSANGDAEIGALIAQAVEKVGREGVITVEEVPTISTTLELVEGMQFDRGYVAAYFVTDATRMEAVFEDAYVLLCEKRLARMTELLPLLEQIARQGKPLVVVAAEIESEALATLLVNKLRGTLKVCAVNAPGFGDRRRANLQDLAALTGGRAITEDLGLRLESITLEDLGRARRITIDKDTTTIVGGAGDVAARVKSLRREIADATTDRDREPLRARLAKLLGGVAVIKVGATTELELKEKKARVEDALHATRAAVEEGVVPGGGVALIRCEGALATLAFDDDRRHGVDVVRRALEAPLRQIAHNCGVDGSIVVGKVREGRDGFGYNAATGVYEDLNAAGIIDPTKVVRVALQHAASVAALMLTTDVLIAARR